MKKISDTELIQVS